MKEFLQTDFAKKSADILLTALISALIAVAQAWLISHTGGTQVLSVPATAGTVGAIIRTGQQIYS